MPIEVLRSSQSARGRCGRPPTKRDRKPAGCSGPSSPTRSSASHSGVVEGAAITSTARWDPYLIDRTVAVTKHAREVVAPYLKALRRSIVGPGQVLRLVFSWFPQTSLGRGVGGVKTAAGHGRPTSAGTRAHLEGCSWHPAPADVAVA